MTGSLSTSSPYLDSPTPLAFAHRGGAETPGSRGIENSLAAFSAAHALGYRYLETDVRCSSDGVVYACHDETLTRLTGNAAAIHDLTAAEVDAERLDNREPIPRLADLYAAFPDSRFNIDVKSEDAIGPTCDTVVASGAVDRTCLAAFSHARLTRIRALLPAVATSSSTREVIALKFAPTVLLRHGARPRGIAVQVPPARKGIRVVTRRFIRRAHRLGLQVHVWTIDERAEIDRLLDLGVDGIISDRTDVLKEAFVARGAWTEPDGAGEN